MLNVFDVLVSFFGSHLVFFLVFIFFGRGLDSLTSMDTIQLLQSLAIEGRTIVCTIHQPCARTFAMFNQIYVMSRGYCTFRGAPHQTVEYLGGLGLQCPAFHNPADFCKLNRRTHFCTPTRWILLVCFSVLECVNGDYGDYLQQLSEEAQKPQWSHCLESCDPSQNTFRRVPFTKISFSTTPGDKTKTNCPVSSNQQSRSATSYNSPPSEFMRLWLLIGRCHMQILRDWVSKQWPPNISIYLILVVDTHTSEIVAACRLWYPDWTILRWFRIQCQQTNLEFRFSDNPLRLSLVYNFDASYFTM